MTPQEIVRSYLNHNYRVVFWPSIGDTKGPREPGWPHIKYSLDQYQEGYRVGILTGTEIAPDRFLHDVDIDWTPGSLIAQSLLPLTSFVFGRASKRVSHCFYTLAEPQPSIRYEDIDKTCLIELRGTKSNGDIGLQTMAPPSIWSKGTHRELLTFLKFEEPTFVETNLLKHRVCLSACAMIIAKHLGENGFGHDPRLAWAGFLLRLGVSVDDLVAMGEAISVYCKNREVHDVRRVIESTATSLLSKEKKVKGGPALARIIGPQGKAVLARVTEWLGKETDFFRDAKGQVVAKHQGNIRRAIELTGDELSYDEFADKLLFNKRPLEDPQWMGLYLKIDREFNFQPPIDYFKMVIKDLAWHNAFHPVKEYLNTLQWDQTARIDRWLIDAARAEDTEYVRTVSAIMLIAAVRRIKQPGCKFDELVIFESSLQGTDKSTAAQSLCPDPTWFSDDLRLNLHSQEMIESTLGKWIIEASDLAGKRKVEIEQLKAMLSRQVDGPARLAYAHFPVERPRHFIIIGTTNSSAYLPDPTGARRFWPIAVKRFNIHWIREHRDQLWAEACVREAAGESIRLPESLWPHAGEEQERRREIDPWEVILRRTLLAIEPGSGLHRRVSTNKLWEALNIPAERRDRYGSLRITEIMQKLGFKRTRVRPDGEEVQVGFIQDTNVIELKDDEAERVVGEDDEVPF